MTGLDGSGQGQLPHEAESTLSELKDKLEDSHWQFQRVLTGLINGSESDRSDVGAVLGKALRIYSVAMDNMISDAVETIDAARSTCRGEVDMQESGSDEV